MEKQFTIRRYPQNGSEPELVLASGSPRRSELLAQIGVNFIVLAVDIDESRQAHEAPEAYVQRLALRKASVGRERSPHSCPVLGADTIVEVDGHILGKPHDADEALAMIGMLSGRCHRVLSAVAVVSDDFQGTRLCMSHVYFRRISTAERRRYWNTGEQSGKAGAYAIQGRAAVFIEHLEGSYSGVMGLPLYETGQLLAEIGIDPLR